mgnify:CR=1 FL=1
MVDELSKPIFSALSFIQSTNNLSNKIVRVKNLYHRIIFIDEVLKVCLLKNEKSGRFVKYNNL